ncbi:1,4-dihydroxy-2-naphthoate octaprenyltransferase [Lactobacillus colini]|uniref:1,4-dihydroxy-2-naphthoate octaprenyltransferase n=1 Tax=Lactobacillus colini TaxID=1819254 RepID=A0ABS4MEF9_9LACO|nr:UbiA family prenyltransferase [Lactobacillus colini]MBP2057752.1 1,4-dihydroxy-2-naphthoate octaprenyltransferase [Lactobacillus colini]
MTIKKYFKFVDIKTSILSLYAYALSAAFIFYYLGNWNWLNAIVFFIAELIQDNMVTGINNVMDYRNAKTEKTRSQNVMAREKISMTSAVAVIIILLTISVIAGIWLCFRTNWFLLVAGMVLFGIVCCYTAGPFPIDKMPIGEFFCGIAQGMGVPFLFAYVNDNYERLITLNFTNIGNDFTFNVHGSLLALIAIILVCYPSMMLNSGVMLANNMSDIENDKLDHRYTLPIVFGTKKAANLYRFYGYSPYLAIILAVILKMSPIFSLLTLLTFPKVRKNVETFLANPGKGTTFPTSLANYRLVVGIQALTMFIGALLHF